MQLCSPGVRRTPSFSQHTCVRARARTATLRACLSRL